MATLPGDEDGPMSELVMLAILAPAIPFLVGFVLPKVLGTSPQRAARLAEIAAAAALGAIGLGIAADIFAEPGTNGAEVPLRLDAVGAVMLATVSLIGAVVARFARRYLDRDPAQRAFSIWLSYTLSAILVLPIATNLLVFFAAWVMSSHGLHHLLTLYRERPAALLAARKKFLISRLGDAFLLLAIGSMFLQWGSLDFSTVFARASADAAAGQTTAITWISLFVMLGAITKSAQFPLHSWLPETMEAPTPVSALMHAGIINGGGFLLVRMSPLLAHAPGVLTGLAFIGAFSAAAGSLVMLTQNDVKRKLAFSTISQMGFMMMQCGLGAFAAAMLHIVGHSFYKAHAFLSAGSWVDPIARDAAAKAPARTSSPAGVALALLIGFAVTTLCALAMGIDIASKPGGLVLIGVVAIGLAQAIVVWTSLSGRALSSPKSAAFVLFGGGGLAVFYLTAVSLLDGLLGDGIGRPLLAVSDPTTLPGFALVGMFLTAMLLQTFRPTGAAGEAWTHVYVLLRNGFHLGEIQNRWVQRIYATWARRSNPAR